MNNSNTLFAAGTVDCVYPMPVAADDVLDLMVFEMAENEETHVTVSLSHKYDENTRYTYPRLAGMHSDEFNTTMGSSNEFQVGGGYSLKATKALSSDTVYRTPCFDTLADLLVYLKTTAQTTGTVNFTFKTYPNGFRCKPTILRTFRIVL